MCGVCGCDQPEAREHEAEHEHVLADGTVVRHHHHDGEHLHEVEPRRVRVERDLLARNDAQAAVNRRVFEQQGTLVLNLMSSPGSGKTSVLVRSLEALRGTLPVAVIEGDQETSIDADRIRHTGVPALQLNTGKGCHLDAQMIARAMEALPPLPGGVLFVENVGNLVCPAGFDLGESQRVVVVSVTEGEDKPLKYPDMFAVADVVLVNKADLLPHLDFDLGLLERNLKRINPEAQVLIISARTGEGFPAWLGWLEAHRPKAARAAELRV